MLRDRVKGAECNAGVIFDNLTSPYWADWKFAIELICEALPTQNVMLLTFLFQKEGEDNLDVCSNIRYVRRKDQELKEKLKKDAMVKTDDDAPKKKGKKQTVRPVKRNHQQEE